MPDFLVRILSSHHEDLILISLTALFSLNLTPNTVGGAELTLGGIDNTKVTNPITYVPVVQNSGFWQLKSSKFSVNGKSTSTLTASRTIIFDSGTSNLVFPKAVAEVGVLTFYADER